MRFSDCLETDMALARWNAQREWRLWLAILRRLERRQASHKTLDAVRVALTNAKYMCRTLRLEMRA